MSRRSCIILGAGGLVGQRLQQRLINHPNFEIKAIAGSKDSSGKSLTEIDWKLEQNRPNLPELIILDLNDENFIKTVISLGIKIAFSALPDYIASIIEVKLSDAGITVFSNSNANRRKKAIPLVIPEVNPNHLYKTPKKIFCATNCTLLPVAIPLAAIYEEIQIEQIKMHSEQALSGAGWRLLFDEEALKGNLQTLIDGEAEKVSLELLHVFGQLKDQEVASASFTTDFECRRVSRANGHQVFVEITTRKPVNIEKIKHQFKHFYPFEGYLNTPSSPFNPIHMVDSIDTKAHLWSDGKVFSDKPNPSKDLKTGMAIVVGDIECIDEHKFRFSAYSHNTIRGAAGGVVLLAELALMNSLI